MMAVGIVGLGLIGGSMARAVKRAGHQVYGTDIDRTVVMKAKLLEIVDQELTDENMADCEVIILGCLRARLGDCREIRLYLCGRPSDGRRRENRF